MVASSHCQPVQMVVDPHLRPRQPRAPSSVALCCVSCILSLDRNDRLTNPTTCLGTPTYAMVAMPAVLASFSLLRIATSLRPVFPEFGLRCVSDRLAWPMCLGSWGSPSFGWRTLRCALAPTLAWMARTLDRLVQQGERAPRTREHPSPLRVGTSMLTQCAQGVETA